jgi:cyclic-di-GMP-binding protein
MFDYLKRKVVGMFDFLKRDKSGQDPLTDLKTVTRWMQDLPAGDVYSAQEKVVENLIQFNRAQLPPNKERLQVLMHLDENARDMQYSLCAQYLRNPRMSKAMESKLWLAIHAFFWEVTRGYHTFLMDFVSNPGGSKIQSSVPLITARAIQGFGDILKWRYFRYEVIDDKLWLRLHNLYRIAEFDHFERNSIRLYKHSTKANTCLGKYTQALLLSRFGNGTMTPRQLDMVDTWLDNWSDSVKVDKQFVDTAHLFYVDTSRGEGLQRILQPGREATLRFINSNQLAAQAANAIESIKNGASPAVLGLGEDFRMPDGLTLLERVFQEWTGKVGQNRRRSERKPNEGNWGITLGMDNICLRLSKVSGQGRNAPLSPDELMDIKLYGFVTDRTKKNHLRDQQTSAQDQLSERWRQMDMSENGLGFVVNPEQSPWVKIGKLLALRHSDEKDWVVGCIRRIARIDNRQQIIGVSLFAGEITAVQIKLYEKNVSLTYEVNDISLPASTQLYHALLWKDENGLETLLMEGAGYSRDRKYLIYDKNNSRLIQLDAVEDKGEDWLQATFRVLAGA